MTSIVSERATVGGYTKARMAFISGVIAGRISWMARKISAAGNPGLDCLCRDGETLDDVWPWIAEDLKTLDGGMEPFVEHT